MPWLIAAALIACCASCSGNNAADSFPDGARRMGAQIGYHLNKEANEAAEAAVRETFRRWEGPTHFRFEYRGRAPAGLRRDGKNTVSFLTRWPAVLPKDKIAYCRNWFDRKGRIVESDIVFNMRVARFTTELTKREHSFYIEGVLAHEIGHMIGLGHIDSAASLMKPLSPRDESYFKGRIDEATLSLYAALYPSESKRLIVSSAGKPNGEY